jgi:hypothetical protein
MTKAIIDIFAMKTCTKLGPKLVRHSVGSRHVERTISSSLLVGADRIWENCRQGH